MSSFARAVSPAGHRTDVLARARVVAAGETLALSLTDGYGRAGERKVRDVATAAALVESWTRQEALEVELPPLAMVGDQSAAATPVAFSAAAPARARSPRAGVSQAFETTAATDGTTWLGGSVSACARFGPVCAGGLVRAATDTGWTQEVPHSRVGVDLLATGSKRTKLRSS